MLQTDHINLDTDQKTLDGLVVKQAVRDVASKHPKLSNEALLYFMSDDFSSLDEYFDQNEFTFIKNVNNKFLNDFYLFQYSKHFIIGPTSFHWWGAWLNENPNKICLRPSNINPSNNSDFWPNNWISI